jgi:hypothetical protein
LHFDFDAFEDMLLLCTPWEFYEFVAFLFCVKTCMNLLMEKKIIGQFSRITFALKFKRWLNLNSLFIYISAIYKAINSFPESNPI